MQTYIFVFESWGGFALISLSYEGLINSIGNVAFNNSKAPSATMPLPHIPITNGLIWLGSPPYSWIIVVIFFRASSHSALFLCMYALPPVYRKGVLIFFLSNRYSPTILKMLNIPTVPASLLDPTIISSLSFLIFSKSIRVIFLSINAFKYGIVISAPVYTLEYIM